MSVINQMLKDLEQRSPEPNNHSAQISDVALAHSPRKMALFTGIGVFAVCFMSFYVWLLISENNALKSQQIINSANAADIINTNTNTNTNKNTETSRLEVTSAKSIVAANNVTLANNNTLTPPAVIASKEAVAKQTSRNEHPDKKVSVNTEHSKLNKTSVSNHAQTNAELKAVEPIVNNNVSRVTPAKKTQITANTHSQLDVTSDNSHEIAALVKPAKNKMSVSRRQLSADELAEQKITLAEKALAAQQIEKAEQLLEDAIIIRPSDSQTRKKLAALWFGRQAYQDAVNLLSQGIALNGKDSSLRMMQARIHLKQGQVSAALNTLKPLAQLKDEQYQTMLANIAQQAQQNKVAVNAYKMLITMQPDIGRWHLGLAVLYDQNSQFTLASAAYKKALTKNDLSFSSENFVNQRIQAIGQ